MFYTIDTENAITAYETEARIAAGEMWFTTKEGLAAATAAGGMAQLVEIWNGMAGVAGPFVDLKPVKRFTDYQTGVERIWRALQRLAPQTAEARVEAPAAVAGLAAPAKKGKKGKTAPVTKTTRKASKPKPAPSDKKQTAKTTVLDMIQRKGGASLEEIMGVTGWQPHTVRGFISTAPRKAGLDVTSSKVEGRGRVYEAR